MRRTARHSLVALVSVVLPLVTGCGADGDAGPEREYTLRLRAEDDADEYRYVAEDPFDVRAGDEVTFELTNAGALAHDLQVVAPDGEVLGTAPAATAGGTASLTVLFGEPGFYRLNCLVDDHLTAHGMQAVIEVTEPGA